MGEIVTVLADKFRPKSFEEVVGQPVAVQICKGLLSRYGDNGILPASILFYGEWGTGKTTLARLLAAYLNCQQGPNNICKPPNLCNSCKLLSEDKHPDILEQDAASHGGKEDVQRLQDWLHYITRYKVRVIILDEAQRLSSAAWDTLLKHLESDPRGTLIVLSTTEHDKVPSTIRSRGYEVYLQHINSAAITERLKEIAGIEGLSIPQHLFPKIAEITKGHARDAIMLMEQLSLMPNADDDLLNMSAGLTSAGKVRKFIEVLTQGGKDEIVKELVELRDEEPRLLIKSSLQYLQDEIIRRYNVDRNQWKLPNVSNSLLMGILKYLERVNSLFYKLEGNIFLLYALLP